MRKLSVMAMMLALAVVLGFYATVQVGDFLKVGFAFIPNELTGMLFGPAAGGLLAALADIAKYLVKPVGGIFSGIYSERPPGRRDLRDGALQAPSQPKESHRGKCAGDGVCQSPPQHVLAHRALRKCLRGPSPGQDHEGGGPPSHRYPALLYHCQSAGAARVFHGLQGAAR